MRSLTFKKWLQAGHDIVCKEDDCTGEVVLRKSWMQSFGEVDQRGNLI